MTKKIAILVCDHNIPTFYQNAHNLYVLWTRFFEDTDYTPEFFMVIDDTFPDQPYEYYLITGSRRCVLQNEPWMQKLAILIQSRQYKKMLGICFGHQMIAQALGGAVESGQWHIGVHSIQSTRASVDFAYQTPLHVRFNHQDHVFELPPNAIACYTSAICEYASFMIEHQILSMQFHPEFTQEYHHFVHQNNKNKLSAHDYEEGLKHLDLEHDHDIVKKQIIKFLDHKDVK